MCFDHITSSPESNFSLKKQKLLIHHMIWTQVFFSKRTLNHTMENSMTIPTGDYHFILRPWRQISRKYKINVKYAKYQKALRTLSFSFELDTVKSINLLLGWIHYNLKTSAIETEPLLLPGILQKFPLYYIPNELTINTDQTFYRFVVTEYINDVSKRQKYILRTYSIDKRSITLTLCKTYSGTTLTIFLIYKGKAARSLWNVDYGNIFAYNTMRSVGSIKLTLFTAQMVY